MNYDPAARQIAEARALTIALAIASKVGWSLRHAGPVLSFPFAGYLYVETAELLLVPTSASLEWQRPIVSRAMREARSDALIVSVGPGTTSPSLAVGIWMRDGNDWQVAAVPALDDGSALWLSSDEGDGPAWRVKERRLRAAPAPWRSSAERQRDQRRAAEWLSCVLEG
jgi:hypothetical protein